MSLLSGLALAQTAPALTPTGRISEVVVFPDRASVTRVLHTPLTAGPNQVRFSDLPPAIDLRSLQADGSGLEGASIRGLDVETRELVEDRRKRVADLEDEILVVQDQLREQSDVVASARQELEFLGKLQAASASQLSAELLFAKETVADAEALANLLRKRTPEVQERVRVAEIAMRDLRDRLAALQRELGSVRGASQWSRRDVIVQIEAPKAGEADVTLTYILPGASWEPSYDARARVSDGKVDLTLNAVVTQTSGEDWTDVGLTLSTARPSQGVAPPDLDPFWLQRPVYAVGNIGTRGSGMGAGGYGEMEEMYDLESDDDAGMEKRRAAKPSEPPAPQMVIAVAEVAERAVATTFGVPGDSSVPGDGTRRKLRVTQVELEVEFLHVGVPRLDESAYLVGSTTWSQTWPLLGGDVSAFLDDAFVGTMHHDTVGTGGDVELAFGADDAVRIEREVVTDRTGNPDWLGKITHELAWDLKVRNGRTTPVKIELRDRLPVSKETKYRVRYRGDEPTEEEAEGKVTFVRELTPGQESAVRFGYTVRYPRKDPPGGVQ